MSKDYQRQRYEEDDLHQRIVFHTLRHGRLKPHNDHNPFMYFAISMFVCGGIALALYLMSIGL